MTANRPSLSMRLLLAVISLVGAAFLGACSSGSRPSVSPQTHTIVIKGSAFQPPALTVNSGDTVEWKNNDIVPHTATSTDAGSFDSGRIEVGGSWKYVANKKGTFNYECSFHPNMQGQLVVK
jgi:plastocyanin